ncbi:sensor histidine kinase [Verrucomicrobiota bacterium]
MKYKSRTFVPGELDAVKSVSMALRDKELRALIELSRLMNAISDRDTLLLQIIQRSAKAMDAEGASVILLEDENAVHPDLVFHVATGKKSDQLVSFKLAWGEGYAGKAARTRRSMMANDLVKDETHSKRVDKTLGFVTRSLIASPLLIRNRLVGVLEVINKRGNGHFSENDVEFCKAIANQVAVAIERAKLAEENVRNHRLAAIGETIAGAAHCIKNIVNAVRGGIYIVDKGLTQKKLDQVRNGWQILKKGMERTSALSLDMLTFSKERKPEYGDVNIGRLLADVCRMVKESAAGRGVEVTIRDDANFIARADAAGIQRCLLNLVANAVDACAEKGKGKVEIACQKTSDEFAEILVSDNGSGMSREVQEKLFQPFFSTKGSKGTGLGLSVTRKIIEEHGGRLAVTSAPGSGTAFTISLPLASPVKKDGT